MSRTGAGDGVKGLVGDDATAQRVDFHFHTQRDVGGEEISDFAIGRRGCGRNNRNAHRSINVSVVQTRCADLDATHRNCETPRQFLAIHQAIVDPSQARREIAKLRLDSLCATVPWRFALAPPWLGGLHWASIIAHCDSMHCSCARFCSMRAGPLASRSRFIRLRPLSSSTRVAMAIR
jgi:hypothetical protein